MEKKIGIESKFFEIWTFSGKMLQKIMIDVVFKE